MLLHFVIGLPLLLFAVFGILALSEASFLIGSAGQASFFAARADFVSMQDETLSERAVAGFEISSLRPMESREHVSKSARAIRTERVRKEGGTSVVATITPPFLPLPLRYSLQPAAEYSGRTGLPPRGADR